MNLLDVILLLIRWIHAIAAVSWVGGGIFYLIVLKPATKNTPLDPTIAHSIGEDFRHLVYSVMAILLVTGIILSTSKLADGNISLIYVLVLAIKIILAGYMFFVVRFLRSNYYPEIEADNPERLINLKMKLTGPTSVTVIGIVVFGIADLLAFLG